MVEVVNDVSDLLVLQDFTVKSKKKRHSKHLCSSASVFQPALSHQMKTVQTQRVLLQRRELS